MIAYKEPLTINLTCSPKELRRLADLCEERAKRLTIGETCFVDFLHYGSDFVIKLNLDQERTKGSPNFTHE